MAESRPPQRKQRLRRVAQALTFVLSGLIALPSYADLRPRARPRIAPPMRFVRVTSAEAACKPNCPEWLSAEGRIGPGTAKAFADVIANLKGRRLPILIHSPGGSVADAGAMGELIRAKGLAVAVARTLISNCPEASPKCPDGPGMALTGGATCASACVLVLAGGVERLAAASARIGVHQTTTVVSETEGLAAPQVDAEDLRAARGRRGGRGLSRRNGRGGTGDDSHAQDVGGQHSLAERRGTQGLAPRRPLALDASRADPRERRERPQRQRSRWRSDARSTSCRRAPRRRRPQALRPRRSRSAIAVAVAWSRRRRSSAI